MGIEVVPLDGNIGVELRGVDLSRELNPAAVAEIDAAFWRHHLLLIRGQDLDHQRQIAFSNHFGVLEQFVDMKDQLTGYPELLRVSNIDQDTNDIRDLDEPGHRSFTLGTSAWHSDSSYLATPSKASLLYAVEVPPTGGETEFADMVSAYKALNDDRKRELADMVVIHDFEEARRRNGLPPRPLKVRLAVPAVEHPLVRTRDDGVQALFLGSHTSYVIGKPYPESQAFLAEIEAFATQPQFVYRHQWQPGDLVFWDNLCFLHRAMPYDQPGTRRLLHRTTVAGEIPSPQPSAEAAE